MPETPGVLFSTGTDKRTGPISCPGHVPRKSSKTDDNFAGPPEGRMRNVRFTNVRRNYSVVTNIYNVVFSFGAEDFTGQQAYQHAYYNLSE